MAAVRYVALLRGINVGGRNIVPMAALRDAFESDGYGSVRTYIQSGNVLFTSSSLRASLEGELESALLRRFGLEIVVVVRSLEQLRGVIDRAPDGFGEHPDDHLCDVVFLKAPLTVRSAMEVVETREGVDRAWPGRDVLYFERSRARRTETRLSKVATRPEYKLMTIRSWTTTRRLLDLSV